MQDSKEAIAGDEPANEQEAISDLVHRALIQAADMRTIEEKMHGIVEKSSKMTPPPEAA